MQDDTSADRFREALHKDRCPVCFLVSSSSVERLRSFLNEYVNDPDIRKKISEAGGFCRRHAWQAVSSGNNQVGVALLHHALLKEGLELVEKSARPSLFGNPPPSGECLMCAWERQVDENLSKQWAACWSSSTKLREDFDKDGILCIPHLDRAVRATRRREDRELLAAAGRKALERLLKELEEFLGKQDHLRAHEKHGDEWDSWIRAVRMRVGEKGNT